MKTKNRVGGNAPKGKSQNDERTVVLTKSEYEKLLALAQGRQAKKEWVTVKTLKPIPVSNTVSLTFALAKWGDDEYITVTKTVKDKVVNRNAYPVSVVVKALKELL